jgi:tetratricopeptide (TPR) repeat protein
VLNKWILNTKIRPNDTTIRYSTKANLLLTLAKENMGYDFDKAVDYATRANETSELFGYDKGQYSSLLYMGDIYKGIGEYSVSLGYYLRAIKFAEQHDYRTEIAECLNNIVEIYIRQGNCAKGLEYSLMSLKGSEELKDTTGIGTFFINIASISQILNNDSLADECYQAASKIAADVGNNKLKFESLMGMADAEKDSTKKIEYFFKSIFFSDNPGDKHEISECLFHLGIFFQKKREYEQSLIYYQKALRMFKDFGDIDKVSIILINIGNVYMSRGNYPKAVEYELQGLFLAKKIGAISRINKAYEILTLTNIFDRNYKDANDYGQLFTQSKDSFSGVKDDQRIFVMLGDYLNKNGGTMMSDSFKYSGEIYRILAKFKKDEFDYLRRIEKEKRVNKENRIVNMNIEDRERTITYVLKICGLWFIALILVGGLYFILKKRPKKKKKKEETAPEENVNHELIENLKKSLERNKLETEEKEKKEKASRKEKKVEVKEPEPVKHILEVPVIEEAPDDGLIGKNDKHTITESKPVVIEEDKFTVQELEEARKWWRSLNDGWRYIFRVSLILEGLDSNFENIPTNVLYHLTNNLKEVIVARTDVIDLSPLNNIKSLRKLLINNPMINDLNPVTHLGLEELEIRKSSIGPDQVMQFQKSNPNCIIKTA